MDVEAVPIGNLTPDPANTRLHPDRNRATIRASLKRFKAGRSLVCDKNNVVRAGNGTLAELAEAGIDEAVIVDPELNQVVVVRRKDWTASEATAYSIADNRSGDQAENDDAALAETLRALQSEDFDLAAVGYDDAEVDALIAGLGDEAIDNAGLADAMGELPDGDKSPFQQMTFTVTDAQAETVKAALDAAKDAGDFDGTGNENSNGNALAHIAEAFCGRG